MPLRMALWFSLRSFLITHSCLKSDMGGSCRDLCWRSSNAISAASWCVTLAAVVCSWLFFQFLAAYFSSYSHERNCSHRKKEGREVGALFQNDTSITVKKIRVLKSSSYWSADLGHFWDRTTVWHTNMLST